MQTIAKAEIWLLCLGARTTGPWKVLSGSAFGTELTAADLIGFADFRPELFHLYFMGSKRPPNGTAEVVVDDDSQNLLDLNRGATHLYFRMEELPLTPSEKESVIAYCEGGDYAAVSHLLPRPRREIKGELAPKQHQHSVNSNAAGLSHLLLQQRSIA